MRPQLHTLGSIRTRLERSRWFLVGNVRVFLGFGVRIRTDAPSSPTYARLPEVTRRRTGRFAHRAKRWRPWPTCSIEHGSRLYSYAEVMLGDQELAADVVEETFVVAAERLADEQGLDADPTLRDRPERSRGLVPGCPATTPARPPTGSGICVRKFWMRPMAWESVIAT